MAEEVSRNDYSNGRELGLHEMYYDVTCGRYEMCNYFCSAVLRSNFVLEVNDVEESLKILIQFQPLLRMKVVSRTEVRQNCRRGREYERLYFQPTEVKIEDVLRVRKSKNINDLVEMVEEEETFLSREESYGDGVRWRMVLNMPEEHVEIDKQGDGFEAKEHDSPAEVGSKEDPSAKPKNHNPGDKYFKYEILFIMNHQSVDGISGHDLIYRQFLPILNKIINNLPVDDIFLTPLDLTPSYEEDILGHVSTADKKPAWYIKTYFNLRKAINKAFGGHDGRIKVTAEGSPFLDEKGMGIFKFCLIEELVGRILHERKANDVSVHSILVTGLSFAVIRLFQDLGKPLPKEIESGWPIDSRKKLAKFKSPQPLGMFISPLGMTLMKVPRPYEFNREVFWHAAANINQQVRKGIQNQREGLFLDVTSYLYNNRNAADYGTILNEAGLINHFEISNLGKCSPGPELDATLPKLIDADEIYFGELGRGSPNNSVPFFNTVVNHKGKMFILSCYNKRWLTRELAGKFMRYLEEVLDEVCESPKKA